MARITCKAVDEHGLVTGSYTMMSDTDKAGYFLATMSLAELKEVGNISECKGYLEMSPWMECGTPTDVNKGMTGATLLGPRLLPNKMHLYSVGPFEFSSTIGNLIIVPIARSLATRPATVQLCLQPAPIRRRILLMHLDSLQTKGGAAQPPTVEGCQEQRDTQEKMGGQTAQKNPAISGKGGRRKGSSSEDLYMNEEKTKPAGPAVDSSQPVATSSKISNFQTREAVRRETPPPPIWLGPEIPYPKSQLPLKSMEISNKFTVLEKDCQIDDYWKKGKFLRALQRRDLDRLQSVRSSSRGLDGLD
ncbi:hypothetical protein NE237_030928 [Protea cynaroides]|uniref:Uncharacterized protein n=1 Tax=Protea cynaroides TaxID=273540 RepID=A0A9Q0GTX3_9MAGN|nr:hypothetical protein NE237_030928 [Protea cynaroides]